MSAAKIAAKIAAKFLCGASPVLRVLGAREDIGGSMENGEDAGEPAATKPDRKGLLFVLGFGVALVLLVALNMK